MDFMSLVLIKFQYPRVSPGDQPLAKEPEDSGCEVAGVREFYYRRISAVKEWKPLLSLYRAANQKI